APIRLWHAYRDKELAALEAILARWKGEPVEALSIPFNAYESKVAAAVPLGEGADLFIEEHKLLGDYRHRKVVPGRRRARTGRLRGAGARRRDGERRDVGRAALPEVRRALRQHGSRDRSAAGSGRLRRPRRQAARRRV